MAEFKMKTIKEIGVVAESEKNKLVLSITEVNGVEKYDLRNYFMKKDSEEWQMGKGVRMTEDELYKLGEIINSIDEM